MEFEYIKVEFRRKEKKMTASEIIKQVVETKGCILIRNRKEDHLKGTSWNYDVKDPFQGNKKGWTMIDLTTANAMLTVYRALRPDLQIKFNNIHFQKLVDFTWKHIS
jgi:hypothetical protein